MCKNLAKYSARPSTEVLNWEINRINNEFVPEVILPLIIARFRKRVESVVKWKGGNFRAVLQWSQLLHNTVQDLAPVADRRGDAAGWKRRRRRDAAGNRAEPHADGE